MWRAFGAAAAVLLFASLAARGDGTAEQKFKSLFGEEAARVAQTPSQEDDLAFAGKLLEAAKAVSDDPNFQIFLYHKAVEFTSRDVDGFPTAKEALELLAKSAPEPNAPPRLKMLEICRRYYAQARGADKKAAASCLADLLLYEGGAFLAQDKPAEAVKTLQEAQGAAQSDAQQWEPLVSERLSQAKARQAADARLAAIRKVLAANPKNTLVAREALSLATLVKDSPAGAKEFLPAAGMDANYAANLELACRDPASLDEAGCAALRDWYRSLAPKASDWGQVGALLRARALACRYLELHKEKDDKMLAATAAFDDIGKELVLARAKLNGGWVDLLDVVDCRRHSVSKSTWAFAEGGITPRSSGRSTLIAPYQPPEEYDLQAIFNRKSGGQCLIAIHDGQQFVCQVSAPPDKSGLWTGSNASPNSNGLGQMTPLASGRAYSLLLQVRKRTVRAVLDSEPIADWRGKPDLRLPNFWRYPPPVNVVGVQTSDPGVTYRCLRVREVSPGGKFLSPEAIKEPPERPG